MTTAVCSSYLTRVISVLWTHPSHPHAPARRERQRGPCTLIAHSSLLPLPPLLPRLPYLAHLHRDPLLPVGSLRIRAACRRIFEIEIWSQPAPVHRCTRARDGERALRYSGGAEACTHPVLQLVFVPAALPNDVVRWTIGNRASKIVESLSVPPCSVFSTRLKRV